MPYPEVRGLEQATVQPPGIHNEVVTACERLGKLISIHEDTIRRLRGPQPETAATPKQAREPESVMDWLAIVHQQLTQLENQAAAVRGSIG